MVDPRKRKYLYAMLAGFGSISLSVILFFILYRLQGIGEVLGTLSRILAPFIYGGVLAYLLRPLCGKLELFFGEYLPSGVKKFSQSMAVLVSLLTGILALYALIILIVPQLYISVTMLWVKLPGKVEEFLGWAVATFGEDERIVQFFNSRYETFFSDLENWFKDTIVPQWSNIISGVGTSVWKVLLFIYNLLIGLIVATYVLHGRKRYARQGLLIIRSIFPEKWSNLLLEELSYVDKMFGGFIDGKIMDSAIVGVLCYIGCSLLRIPNALLVSTIVGITNVIPFFGPFIGAVPSTLLILIESPIKALSFVIFVLILQQLDGNVIGPRILGNRTGLSGFWVLFAIILFGGMWGIVGMVICVPVFAVFYDLVKKFVIRGLRKRGHMELWYQYRADFPSEDPAEEMPKE